MTSFMIKHNVEDYIKEPRDKADIFATRRLPCKQILISDLKDKLASLVSIMSQLTNTSYSTCGSVT